MLNVSRVLKIGTALAGLAVLAACARLEDSHGYVPDQALLDQVQLGVDTKQTTARLLGRPGTEGIVDDQGWYYVKSDYERFLWRAPKEDPIDIRPLNGRKPRVPVVENLCSIENGNRFGF